MTNPRDDLMALTKAIQNADWSDVSIGNKALLRKAIKCLTESASRPATQVVDREAVAWAICQSGKFETGEGTCALLCMDQLGSPRKKGCCHSARVHGKLADAILSLLRPAEDEIEQMASRPLYTHPPKSPDTSAAVLQAYERCAAIAESFFFTDEMKANTNGARTDGNDRACMQIANAIRQLPTTERGDK